MNQDFVAWVGQGTIADRPTRHLGPSDRGVILLRQRLLADLVAIESGEDPKGIIRDPAANVCVRLPVAERRYLTESIGREELLKHPVLGKQYSGEYPFQAGQPDDVRQAYAKAMGIEYNSRRRSTLHPQSLALMQTSFPVGGTLASCDRFGIPSTSHWTGAAIIVRYRRTKSCIVTRSRTSTGPMLSSLAG